MRRVRALLIGYVLIVLLAGWPVLSIAVAGTIASWNGCELHEGFSNPCVVSGRDLGPTLYSMGVMGWFMIVTIPLGGAAALAWTLIWFVVRRLQPARSTSTGRPL